MTHGQLLMQRVKNPRPLDCILLIFLMSACAMVVCMFLTLSEVISKADANTAFEIIMYLVFGSGLGTLTMIALNDPPWSACLACCAKQRLHTRLHMERNTVDLEKTYTATELAPDPVASALSNQSIVSASSDITVHTQSLNTIAPLTNSQSALSSLKS